MIVEEKLKKYSIKETNTKFPRVKIRSSKDVDNMLRPLYRDTLGIYETFFILCLDRSGHSLGYIMISQGGINATVVDARLIAITAINSLASSVILSHNHPSGNLEPSDQDINLTRKLSAGLKLLDINVLDHHILTADGYFSFGDEGISF